MKLLLNEQRTEVKNANPVLHIVLLREKSENWQKILGNVYQV